MPNENNPQDLQSSHNRIGLETDEDLLRRASGGDSGARQGALHRWTQHMEQQNDRARLKRREQEKKTAPDRTFTMLAAVPFWAVAGTTLRNSLALCGLLIILMIPSACLHFILRRRLALAEWVALPLSVLVATMLASGCCALMTQFDPNFYNSVGLYLFLLAAAPVLLNAGSYGGANGFRSFWGNTFRFIRDFVIVMLFTGAIRELVGYNTLLGHAIPFPLSTEAAGMPFFGLILSGVLLAVLRSLETLLGNALSHRKKAESKAEEDTEEVAK